MKAPLTRNHDHRANKWPTEHGSTSSYAKPMRNLCEIYAKPMRKPCGTQGPGPWAPGSGPGALKFDVPWIHKGIHDNALDPKLWPRVFEIRFSLRSVGVPRGPPKGPIIFLHPWGTHIHEIYPPGGGARPHPGTARGRGNARAEAHLRREHCASSVYRIQNAPGARIPRKSRVISDLLANIKVLSRAPIACRDSTFGDT